ncbi:MAG: hypothetical protein R6W72_03605 [Desulfurivibrionaceae bacterium]
MTSINQENQKRSAGREKKPVAGMLLFGGISLIMYYLLMTNQGVITESTTRGGWYAALPILAAFVFSFIHGAFASNILTVLGIVAKK